MAEKIKTNETGDCIFTEQNAIELLYQNPQLDISKLFFEDTEQFNKSVDKTGINLTKLSQVPQRPKPADFDNEMINNWHMPKKYYELNVLKWLLEKCHSDEERLRVQQEYSRFEQKGFIKVLQFLIYFIETLRANNIVWGVGRGSSVSSFCLFLIGVHKINPMLYNLDYTEFLR